MTNFLEKMRSWPPEKKKKVSIIATIPIMIAVIAAWLLFFNNFSVKNSNDMSNWQNTVTKFKEIIGAFKASK